MGIMLLHYITFVMPTVYFLLYRFNSYTGCQVHKCSTLPILVAKRLYVHLNRATHGKGKRVLTDHDMSITVTVYTTILRVDMVVPKLYLLTEVVIDGRFQKSKTCTITF